jgi:hypothetical protein
MEIYLNEHSSTLNKGIDQVLLILKKIYDGENNISIYNYINNINNNK